MAITAGGRDDDDAGEKTKTTQQENQQEEGDRISELPDDILHAIMSTLTLKEACATSALSKRWRNLFPSLPRLDFDDYSFGYSPRMSRASRGHDMDIASWLELIFDILKSRRAPVRICTIYSDYFYDYCEDFDNIIGILCNGGIQDLTVGNMDECYTLPPCLYLCQTLTRLELCNCQLFPSKFSGLGRLNALKIESCTVEDCDQHRLISACAALESLTLESCLRHRNIVIGDACVGESASLVSYHMEKSKLEGFRRELLLSQRAASSAVVDLKTALTLGVPSFIDRRNSTMSNSACYCFE